MSAVTTPAGLPALRRLLIGGSGSMDAAADELARRYGDRAGIGIAVYARGSQLACRVSLRPPSAASMTTLLALIRSELPAERCRPVVLLSVLGPPRTVSIDDYLCRWSAIGAESIAATRRGRATVILAHVPCFMSWNRRQLAEALVRKQGGVRPLELHLFPTETLWLDEGADVRPCEGGLRERRRPLETSADLRAEMQLVAGYLRGQVTAAGELEYGYDAWRDRSVDVESRGRKAIALGSMLAAARVLGEAGQAAPAEGALAQLATARAPAGDIHDAHLLLASCTDPGERIVGKLRAAIRASGEIAGPGTADQDYFPGVALAALGSRGALSDAECARCLDHYRRRFHEQPSWPALWWQLRAWTTPAVLAAAPAASFVSELADWALARQLPSGAFDTGPTAAAPSFQTICVVEGLLGAIRAVRQAGSPSGAHRYLVAARRAMRFTSSLVLDPRHASILPNPSRAIGGVRTLHTELVLRSDVAGHYLAALTSLCTLMDGD
jgi:hypothetical protein